MTVDRITVGTKSVPYLRFGRGAKNFVILPGMSMFPVTQSPEGVAARFALFAEEYTVWLFDRAEPVTEGIRTEDMADETAAAMTALGIADADMYAASQGGSVALVLAARYPRLVRKAVLASTTAYCTPAARETFAHWSALARAGDAVALNRDIFARVYSAAYREQFADAFRDSESLGTADDCLRYACLAEAYAPFDGRPLLAQLRCPVLAVNGGRDEVFRNALLSPADLPAAEFYVYPNGAHAVYDEEADFVERIYAFLCR